MIDIQKGRDKTFQNLTKIFTVRIFGYKLFIGKIVAETDDIEIFSKWLKPPDDFKSHDLSVANEGTE